MADLGVTIVPLKSQTRARMTLPWADLLWAIQAWYAEMVNEERSENVALVRRAPEPGKENMSAARDPRPRSSAAPYAPIARSWLQTHRETR